MIQVGARLASATNVSLPQAMLGQEVDKLLWLLTPHWYPTEISEQGNPRHLPVHPSRFFGLEDRKTLHLHVIVKGLL